ncbi:hypothetical protein [Streptomyces sp. NPDC049555]|uniref:hypothetical protein n=1 Tax=Streptomyces sp. NPDC049555 TaxID=3154930 RepID=UPI00344ABC47
MANPGFGKRSAPDQAPPGAHDFVHLPKREASIAAFIDRLPEGAAMDVKTLAKVLPDYGQQACRTALRRLREAGHVFIRQVAATTKAGVRWVTLTFFSRTARSQAWWEGQLGERPEPRPAPEPEEPEPAPAVAPQPRSRAYGVLSRLRFADARLTLSAAECEALEPLTAQWLARDMTPEQLTAAVTTGLPQSVHHPAGLVRSRLTAKMPLIPLRHLVPPPPPVPPGQPVPDTFRVEGAPPVVAHSVRADDCRIAAGITPRHRRSTDHEH